MPPAKAAPPTEAGALVDHVKFHYQAVHRTVRNVIALEPAIDSCIGGINAAMAAETAKLKTLMSEQMDSIANADFNMLSFESKISASTAAHRNFRGQVRSLEEYKDFVIGCQNRTVLVIGEKYSTAKPIIKKKCCVCREMVADIDSLICDGKGCYNCLDCLYGEIASRRSDLHKLFSGKNKFKCFECDVPFATTDVIMRVAKAGDTNTSNGAGGSGNAAAAAAATVALKNILYCEAELARGDSRVAAIRDCRKRAADTPLDKLIRICEGLYCPSCDALYDSTTEGASCMHASCSVCTQKFCGFCFDMECEASTCRLNPQPGSLYCSSKVCALAVCKALQISNLLKSYSTEERVTLLDSIEYRLAEFVFEDEDGVPISLFSIKSPSLYHEDIGGLDNNYAGPRVLNELAKVYCGKNGTIHPTVDYNSIRVGDWVTFTKNLSEIRTHILKEGAYHRTCNFPPAVEHAKELADPELIWQVVSSGPDTSNSILTVASMITGQTIDVFYEWIVVHIPFDFIFKAPDLQTLSVGSLVLHFDGAKSPVADAKAETIATNTQIFVGDWVFVDKSIHELEIIFDSLIVITDQQNGNNGVFENPGWHPKYKNLAGRWHYVCDELVSGKYKVIIDSTTVHMPATAVTHFIRGLLAQVGATFAVSGFVRSAAAEKAAAEASGAGGSA